MTLVPDAPRLVVADPDEAIRALRESGLRLSTARRLIIEALFSARAGLRPGARPGASARGILDLPQPRGARTSRTDPPCPPRSRPRARRARRPRRRRDLDCERCGKLTVLAPDQLAEIREDVNGDSATTRDSPTSRWSGCAGLRWDTRGLRRSLRREPAGDLVQLAGELGEPLLVVVVEADPALDAEPAVADVGLRSWSMQSDRWRAPGRARWICPAACRGRSDRSSAAGRTRG